MCETMRGAVALVNTVWFVFSLFQTDSFTGPTGDGATSEAVLRSLVGSI